MLGQISDLAITVAHRQVSFVIISHHHSFCIGPFIICTTSVDCRRIALNIYSLTINSDSGDQVTGTEYIAQSKAFVETRNLLHSPFLRRSQNPTSTWHNCTIIRSSGTFYTDSIAALNNYFRPSLHVHSNPTIMTRSAKAVHVAEPCAAQYHPAKRQPMTGCHQVNSTGGIFSREDRG